MLRFRFRFGLRFGVRLSSRRVLLVEPHRVRACAHDPREPARAADAVPAAAGRDAEPELHDGGVPELLHEHDAEHRVPLVPAVLAAGAELERVHTG